MKLTEYIDRIKNGKEFRDYLIWGVASAALNVGLFQVLVIGGMDYRYSNIITLIVVRIFVYLTNKFFVFRTKCDTMWKLVKEIVAFFLARTVTLLMDFFGVIFLVEILSINSFISKLVTAIVVILTNYSFSKLFVFKKVNGDNHQ